MDNLDKAIYEYFDYVADIQEGLNFINKLKKYENKTITLNILKKLFTKNDYDYILFEENYAEHLYTEGEIAGCYDVISLDECYIGFTYEILPKDKIKITGFYKDS